MLQGSPIDKEFHGVSTMELINFLDPVVCCVGNHEIDYGLPNLLWLEKLANFPIICANIYIKGTERRLLKPHYIANIYGVEILFVGVVTNELEQTLKLDKDIYERIEIRDAATEVIKVVQSFGRRVPLTIILSHLGLAEDRILASKIPPSLGVNFIIGGHSHTLMRHAEVVNSIPIVQAGTGTGNIGRFDMTLNLQAQTLDFVWKLESISNQCPRDPDLDTLLQGLESTIAAKHGTVLSTLKEELFHMPQEISPTNPLPILETTMGNFFTDTLLNRLGSDMVLLIAGSLRVQKLRTTLTVGSIHEASPFTNAIVEVQASGATLFKMFQHFMSKHSDIRHNTFAVSKGIRAIFDLSTNKLYSLTLNGKPLVPDQLYTIAMTDWVCLNRATLFGLTDEDTFTGTPLAVHAPTADIMIEVLRTKRPFPAPAEGRLTYVAETPAAQPGPDSAAAAATAPADLRASGWQQLQSLRPGGEGVSRGWRVLRTALTAPGAGGLKLRNSSVSMASVVASCITSPSSPTSSTTVVTTTTPTATPTTPTPTPETQGL
ncbi:bifunctional metallophosphatase/5'-nucleotidase [Pelomyxa schiedti]|nr:bifunctional metallophosphatase/5'-nucleotidase [Pelomyxa schiedti]